jgi:hypothetical protein
LHRSTILRWVASLLLAGAPIATWGSTVTVLDPDGRPLADALVTCLAPEESSVLTDSEGAATVPDLCSAVSCRQGGHLPGRATVARGAATCRLTAGLRVTVALGLPGCAATFQAGLVPVDVAVGEKVWSSSMEPEPDSGGCAARLGPVATGTYMVWVGGGEGWTCRGRIVLSLQDADEVVRATWRSPLQLPGTVLDSAGRPAADIPVWVREPVGDVPQESGEWRCTPDDQPGVFTQDDGSFQVLVDPDRRIVIEAGSSWDPDGFASLEVGPLPGDSVVLRLRR